MISVDTNILLAAFRTLADEHKVAKETLNSLLSQTEQVAFTDIVINEFFANVTNSKLSIPYTTIKIASQQIENWLSAPCAKIIRGKPGNFDTFIRLCAETGRTGQQIYDAQIAAICIDNGVTEFITNDLGFEDFTELRIRNPFKK